jgi:hypothetical protein
MRNANIPIKKYLQCTRSVAQSLSDEKKSQCGEKGESNFGVKATFGDLEIWRLP